MRRKGDFFNWSLILKRKYRASSFCLWLLIFCIYWIGPSYFSYCYAQDIILTNAGTALLSGIDLGSKQEIIEKRTRCSKTFLNPDGSYTFVASISPVHYQDAKGNWREIDTRVLSDGELGWDYQMVNNSWHVYFRELFNEGPVLKYEYGNEWVTVQPASLKWVNKYGQQEVISMPHGRKAVVRDNIVYYTDGYGSGIDMRYLVVPERIVKELIVHSKSDLPSPKRFASSKDVQLELSFSFEYSDGIELFVGRRRWNDSVQEGLVVRGDISFVKDGKVLFYWQSPEFHDSSGGLGRNRSDLYSHSSYYLNKKGNRVYVSVCVPKIWLDNAVYPIYIDPTFETQPNAADGKDNYLGFQGTIANYGISTTLMGYGNTQRVILIEFDLSSIPDSAKCNSATLSLWYNSDRSTSGNDRTWYVREVSSANGDWTEGTKNGATAGTGESCRLYKAYNTTYWDYDDQTDGFNWDNDTQGVNIGTAIVNNPVTGEEVRFSLSPSAVEDWFGTSNENYGIALIVSSYDGSHFLRSSDNSTVSQRPKLVVVYEAGGSFFINFP